MIKYPHIYHRWHFMLYLVESEDVFHRNIGLLFYYLIFGSLGSMFIFIGLKSLFANSIVFGLCMIFIGLVSCYFVVQLMLLVNSHKKKKKKLS